jgi:hypothetical protein
MPIQAHALPWDSLASNFEYRPAKSGVPGDQRADLFPKDRTTQRQQLEHFALSFQEVLQEHTSTLRAKLKSPEQYKARARIWRTSKTGTASDATDANLTDSSTPNEPKQSRNGN